MSRGRRSGGGGAGGRRGGEGDPAVAGAGELPSHSESASVSHPLSYPAGRCKLARGQAHGQQEQGELEEEEEAPEEDEEGEFLFISGRLASWSVWTRLTVP